MIVKIKKPKSSGDLLLERHGPGYFSKLAKKGVKKRRAAMKLWEQQEALKNQSNRHPVKK